jgi:hypothetical protein
LARVPQLRAALGDYPLHIDATCEHGKGGLFVCIGCSLIGSGKLHENSGG